MPDPGWYQNPQDAPATERWWDGTTWTDHTRGAGASGPGGAAPAAGASGAAAGGAAGGAAGAGAYGATAPGAGAPGPTGPAPGGPGAAAGGYGAGGYPPTAGPSPFGGSGGGDNKRRNLTILGVVAVIAVIGVLVFAFAGGDDENAGPTTTTTTEAKATTTEEETTTTEEETTTTREETTTTRRTTTTTRPTTTTTLPLRFISARGWGMQPAPGWIGLTSDPGAETVIWITRSGARVEVSTSDNPSGMVTTPRSVRNGMPGFINEAYEITAPVAISDVTLGGNWGVRGEAADGGKRAIAVIGSPARVTFLVAISGTPAAVTESQAEYEAALASFGYT